tara:strand:+ start:1390 stop:2976 length:1587 start_codon:yes stop_codon:yes gene_type:complete
MKAPEPGAARELEQRAWRWYEQGEHKRAALAAQQLNRQFPTYAPGWYSTSQLAMRLNNNDVALAAIDRALALQPDEPAWLLQRANCLMRAGRVGEARPIVQALSESRLRTAYQYATLGLLLSRLDMQEQALPMYRRAVELEPGRSENHYNLATVLRFLGRLEECEHSLDRAIELNPRDWEAHGLRAQVRRQTVERNHVAQLESLLGSGEVDARGEVRLCYALAKELEDVGQPRRSFHYLRRGATRRRNLMRYDVEDDLQTMQAIAGQFDADFFSREVGSCDNDEAIFILGLPRTGSTLLERVLASHPAIGSVGESNNLAIELTRLAGAPGRGKRELVARAATIDFGELGRRYVETTRPASGRQARFLDKMPLNFLYAGLIHAALPRARIICMSRHPLDTCYAIYKTLFQDAYPYSYDLQDLGRYYAGYEGLMAHWERVLPGVIHRVDYEELVRDLRGVAAAALAFCGLDWDERCLQFHRSRQASTTASASQVREPVYATSIGRWRDYREELQPLIEVLDRAGIACDLA